MLFTLGTVALGISNTLAIVDGYLVHRGRRVTSLTDVVHVCTNGNEVVAVTRAGALYYFEYLYCGATQLDPYSPEIHLMTASPWSAFNDGLAVECVAMGDSHIIAVLTGRTLIGKGINNNGCLGVVPTYPCQRFLRFVDIGGGDLANGTAASVAAGYNSSAVIDEYGVLHVQGANYTGQFGLAHNTSVHEWQRVALKSVVNVSIMHHTLVVLKDGSLYVAGGNGHGQLGVGDLDDRHVFTHIVATSFGSGVGSAACGPSHSVVVDKAGGIFFSGQLANSSDDQVALFTKKQGLPAMAGVVAGIRRCAGVSRGGEIFEWGPYASGFSEGLLLVLPHDSDMPPTMMLAGLSLVERLRPLHAAHKLAFVMGLHARLGDRSRVNRLSDDLLNRIVDTCAHVESASEKVMRGEC